MSLLLHIIVTYSKKNIITKLQKLYSSPRNPRAGNKSPAIFVKKPLCTGDLSPARKMFIERPDIYIFDRKLFLVNFTSLFYFYWVCEIFMKKTTETSLYAELIIIFFPWNQSPIVKFKHITNFHLNFLDRFFE